MLQKWNDIVPTYVEVTKKNLGNISNVKFFTVDPYFGGIFKVDDQKCPKIAHFGIFIHIGGVGGGQKNVDLKI